MAPKGWTTNAQAEFLTSFLPLYDTYALRKRYQPFWDTINAKYLRQFPILPEGVSADSLNEEDRQSYTQELNKLYMVCRVP
jgi:CTP:phosphocholine cytidylyltransferase-like protein